MNSHKQNTFLFHQNETSYHSFPMIYIYDINSVNISDHLCAFYKNPRVQVTDNYIHLIYQKVSHSHKCVSSVQSQHNYHPQAIPSTLEFYLYKKNRGSKVVLFPLHLPQKSDLH